MMTPGASVDDTTELGYDAETEEDWFEEPEELPRRRRRRLLGPVPLALFAVLLIAAGFLAGVLVEKGQSSSSSSAAGSSTAALASRFRALRSAAGGAGAGAGTGTSAGGEGSAARSPLGGGATTGQVSFVEGSTIYLTDAEGNTVKVNTSKGPEVTKTVKTDVKGIHPGETLLITGPTAKDGSVTAESIRVGSTGLSAGLGALLGGGGGGGASGSTSSGGSSSSGSSKSSSGSEPSLFGNG
jgi:hypothetical protein